MSRRQINNEVRWRTSSLKTPSRSPTARTTVSHLFKNASCKKCCIGTSSRTPSFGANVPPAQKHVLYNANKDRRQQRPLEGLRRQRRQKPMPLSPLQVFDICMAIDRARPPSVHHHTPRSHATSHLRARTGQYLRAQASMLTRRRSATRRLGAMRQSGRGRIWGIAKGPSGSWRGRKCHIIDAPCIRLREGDCQQRRMIRGGWKTYGPS